MEEKVNKPWGSYQNLENGVYHKVKKLYINPEEKISLQYHNYRDEHWIIVAGNGIVELEKTKNEVFIGDYIFVPKLSEHRISAGKYGITIVEIQLGNLCEESDITRIEDSYGRI